MSSWKGRLPCAVCGGEKLPGPGQRYCELCREVQRNRCEAERATRDRMQTAEAARDRLDSRQMARDAPPGQFWCGKCARYLPERSRAQGRKNTKSGWCKSCYGVYLHAYRLRKVYGLTPDQYDAMLKAQADACAICGNRPRAKRLAVDHDHYTGEVRGLLCKRCNQSLLGAGEHNPDLLRSAADYLEEPPSRKVLPVGHVVPGAD